MDSISSSESSRSSVSLSRSSVNLINLENNENNAILSSRSKRFQQNDSLPDCSDDSELNVKSNGWDVDEADWVLYKRKQPHRKASSKRALQQFKQLEREWDPLVLSSIELNNRPLLVASIKRKLRNNLV